MKIKVITFIKNVTDYVYALWTGEGKIPPKKRKTIRRKLP